MASSWENVNVDNSKMRVYLSRPENSRPAPAVVVVQGQTGVDDFVKFSDWVATHGIVAAAPDLYHRDPPDCKDDAPTRRMRLRDATVIQDIDATVNYLKSHKSVIRNPDIKAGVMYYGGDPFSAWGEGLSPFDRTKAIHCPIMGHFGEDDKNPSPADMRRLDAELTKFEKRHEFYSYPNAGHAFANFGSGNYRKHAADASWPRTFGFFEKQLKGE